MSRDPILDGEHLVPRSRGGSYRVSNVVWARWTCYGAKGNRIPEERARELPGSPREFDRGRAVACGQVARRTQAPVKDPATVSTTGWAFFLQRLKGTGPAVDVGSGGRTKWNGHQLNIPRVHAFDEACAGGTDGLDRWCQPVLAVTATGRGLDQWIRRTTHGFPRGYLSRNKSACGFPTGDLAEAAVTRGRLAGTYRGRVVIRAGGRFHIRTVHGREQGGHHRFGVWVQRADGYGDEWTPFAEEGGSGASPRLDGRGVRAATI
jgi:hypothetical protein